MKFFIKDKDGCDNDFIVYEVEGSCRQVADEIFVSKFLPLLPGVLCIYLNYQQITLLKFYLKKCLVFVETLIK